MSLEFFLPSNLQDGNTALHVACKRGHDSVVKLLIDGHADLGIACKVSITKPMAIMTAKIPMQHIEALCNACTDRYASYGNNSLPSSFSLTTFPPPPLSSPACLPTVTTVVALLLAAQWHFWRYSSVITSWSASCLGVESSTETRLVAGKDIVSLFLCWLLVLSFFNPSVLSLEFFLSSNLQYGDTALHSACFHGHDSVVKLLIDAHADLGVANKVSIPKPKAFVTARIPMQHIEALCNACTDRYASYGNNSLPSSFSLTTFPPPPLSSPTCYAHSDNCGGATSGSTMTLLTL